MQIRAIGCENQYQLEAATRKLTAIRKKYGSGIKALQLAQYLREHGKKEVTPNFSNSIEARASKSITQTGLSALVKLTIKQELLQHEEKLLKAALEKLF